MSEHTVNGAARTVNLLIPLTIARTTAVLPIGRYGYALIDAEDWPSVGVFRWYGAGTAGEYVGRKYRREDGERRVLYLHRQLMSPPAGMEVDHINLNPRDNRRSNLRIATRGQNQQNLRVRRDSRTGIRGVEFDRRDGKWRAYVFRDGKKISGGTFNDPALAGAAAAELRRRHMTHAQECSGSAS